MQKAPEICFTVERTLGKLAKWLRILGFNTIYEPEVSRNSFIESWENECILLTRTKRIYQNKYNSHQLIFIKSNDPFEQLKEVIKLLDLNPPDIKPFSRCTRCNTLLNKTEKNSIRGKVPDYIWETNDIFQMCNDCHRIYWPGSHTRNCKEIIKKVFERFTEKDEKEQSKIEKSCCP